MKTLEAEEEKNRVETSTAELYLRADGLLVMQIKDDVSIEIEEINDICEGLAKVIGEGQCKLLIYTGTGAHTSKEAREMAASYTANKGIQRQAIITTNLAHRLLANFYMTFHKPKQPMKVFGNEKDAAKWLHSFD